MARAPDRSASPRDTATFVICVGLSLLGLFLPASWGEATAAAIRGTALSPLVWLQVRAEEANTSRARFRALEAQRDSATFALQQVTVLDNENATLRRLLGLTSRLTAPYVPGEVLHQAQITDARTLVVGAGSAQGVAPFDPVASATGLIGVVRTVGANQSLVLTWAHPDFRVSAYTADGRVSGIVGPAAVASEGMALLELRGVPLRDTVATGTLVISSGLGGVFPRGIPVGRVIAEARSSDAWQRIYLLRPAADPATVDHVVIFRLPRQADVGPAFAPDTGATLPAVVPDTAVPPESTFVPADTGGAAAPGEGDSTP